MLLFNQGGSQSSGAFSSLAQEDAAEKSTPSWFSSLNRPAFNAHPWGFIFFFTVNGQPWIEFCFDSFLGEGAA